MAHHTTVLAFTLFLGCTVAQQYLKLSDLSNSNFQIFGAATVGGTAVLTSAIANQYGGFYYNSTVSLLGSFTSNFTFTISNTGGINDDDPKDTRSGGHGMAFIINQFPTFATGDHSYLGYTGQPFSVAVEFDTFMNAQDGDLDGNHVGINLGGNRLSHVAQQRLATPRLNSGTLFYCSIQYDGQTLNIYLNTSSLENTTKPFLSYDVNIASRVGTRGYVGFYGSCGESYEKHTLNTWTFETSCPVGLIVVDQTCGCPAGSYLSSSGTCVLCNPGYFQDKPSSSSTCNQCPAGYYSNSTGSTACTRCLSSSTAVGASKCDCDAATCHQRGGCNADGSCTCVPGYSSASNCFCTQSNSTCDSTCVYGTCDAYGACVCNTGYLGCNCDVIQYSLCSGHGNAKQDLTCSCDANYYGSNCSIHCDYETMCSGNGRCNEQGACVCDANYGHSDCSVIAFDKYCLNRNPPCFPGLDQIASGLDITTGQFVSARFRNFRMNGLLFKGNYKDIYEISDDVDIRSAQQLTSSSEVSIITKSEDFRRSLALAVGVEPVGGMYSANTEVKRVVSDYLQQHKYRSLNYERIRLYQINVDTNTLDDNFVAAVDALPTVYSADAYLSFVQTYGTHYVTQAYVGGIMNIDVSIDQCIAAHQTQNEVTVGAKATVEAVTATIDSSVDTDDISQTFQQYSTTEVNVLGGDPLQYKISATQWFNSITSSPTMISYTVSPTGIQDLISDTTKKANINRAVAEYLGNVTTVQASLDWDSDGCGAGSDVSMATIVEMYTIFTVLCICAVLY